jgi:flavin reductase (DIM6/NTAB) family NADH-FMN oxidoreductase RutF
VSVSAEPPLLSFNLSCGASCWPTIEAASHVGVHLLAEGQHEIATTFSRSGADRFGPATSWHRGPFDVPILDGALGWMVCRIESRIIAGDHAVVIGEVVTAQYVDELRPLVYHRGRFTGLREQQEGSR